MSNHRSRVLSARWILPVASPAIHGGWIRMVNGRIIEVAAGRPPADSEDLGDVAILPRLINAHTHLEFSSLNLPIGEAGISLAEWVGLVVKSRVETDFSFKTAGDRKRFGRTLADRHDLGR